MARKNTISSQLEPMEVGESKDFSASYAMTLQSMASMLGFKWNKRFKTCINREKRVITVTRTE